MGDLGSLGRIRKQDDFGKDIEKEIESTPARQDGKTARTSRAGQKSECLGCFHSQPYIKLYPAL